MRLRRGIVGAALAVMCLWGAAVWCVPLGPEMPERGVPDPLASPVLSPENPLDRELFRREPGNTKTVAPPAGKAHPELPAGQGPGPALFSTPSDDVLPTPPELLPGSLEPGKPAGSPERAVPRDYSRVSEAENPLVDIARRMREAERLLAEAQSGEKTRQLQASIVQDLEELLKQVAAQCRVVQAHQGQRPPQGTEPKADRQPFQGPSQPPAESPKERSEKKLDSVSQTSERPTMGRASQGTPEHRKGLMRGAWGSLPDRDRQQMMQLLPPEKFLPKYESMIEEYYRRLGEENGHARP